MKKKFEAKHIKKATEVLDKELRVAEKYVTTNKGYKNGFFKKFFLWKKVFGVIKS